MSDETIQSIIVAVMAIAGMIFMYKLVVGRRD